MKYENIVEGKFISRHNRFIAEVAVQGVKEICHVKNTGRCKELFHNNPTVYLERSSNPLRKTKYDVVAVLKDGKKLINMDSVAPNYAAKEFFEEKYASVRREVTYKGSRFDLFIEDINTFVEVKGVTLENDGVALFPDAPTKRGVKHIYELIDAKNNGYNASILFVLQFENAKLFMPNRMTDPEFSEALKIAEQAGVKILAYDTLVTPSTMVINNEVTVCLDL